MIEQNRADIWLNRTEQIYDAVVLVLPGRTTYNGVFLSDTDT